MEAYAATNAYGNAAVPENLEYKLPNFKSIHVSYNMPVLYTNFII